MLEAGVRYINEVFDTPHVSSQDLDRLLADGWRHFGTQFFRYSIGISEFELRLVIPLRVRLRDFSISKSQRRVLNRNSDVVIEIGSIDITQEACALFERHKQRFKFGIPDSIYDFLSQEPASSPCEALQLSVRLDGRLIAVSFFDVGDRTVSALYAMFDPDLGRRSLGILTMLREIEFALDSGKEFYYQGYSYEGPSFYDYKKRFRGSEAFDWRGSWTRFAAKRELTADDADPS